MCNRGVFQLRLVKLQFCDWGGSSQGVRDLFKTQLVEDWIDRNPGMTFEAYMRRSRHPYIYTQYINGWTRTLSIRNMKPEEIMDVLEQARNQIGHHAYKHAGNKVISTNTSIQGPWMPNMWGTNKIYQDQKLRKLPEFPLTPKEREPKKPEPKESEKIDTWMRQRVIL
ncbi:unnamed protein product [Blepharisma stoltei]|uniref:Large ribosomal subunit protein mL43 n=1 Tax=Blepharisma stoltei TaxID=1481888 RepID=A0AAU9IPD7_9CILI|nr:unnamed protein product [Blepharisma stoltei]